MRQIYEFVAVDRPLSERERTELRAVSTRAEITATRFRNEYHWGDLRADPRELLLRFFDVHLYAASWGERRFMARLPAARVDVAALRVYLGDWPVLARGGEHHVLELTSDSDCDEADDEVADGVASIGVRAGLLDGDMRAPYLAWLLAVQGDRVADGAREPPVPPGLERLSAPLVALVEFLRIDGDLLLAAASAWGAGARTAGQLRACAAALAEVRLRADSRGVTPGGGSLVRGT